MPWRHLQSGFLCSLALSLFLILVGVDKHCGASDLDLLLRPVIIICAHFLHGRQHLKACTTHEILLCGTLCCSPAGFNTILLQCTLYSAALMLGTMRCWPMHWM